MPAFLVAMVGTSLAVWAIGLPVETIGSRFGEIPSSLPLPSLPAFSLQQAVEVLPSAFTIAFLAGIESRSEEHTSELQSLMRKSYAFFCLKTKHIKIDE